MKGVSALEQFMPEALNSLGGGQQAPNFSK